MFDLSFLQTLKMPPPLVVLGTFFVLIGAQYIVTVCFRLFNFKGTFLNIYSILKSNIPQVVLVIVACMILVYYVDYPVTMFCKQHYSITVYNIFNFISALAEGWFLGGGFMLLIIAFIFLQKPALVMLNSLSLMSLITAGIINTALKVLFNRERPSIILDPTQFFHFFATNMQHYGDLLYASNSMPSGHALAISSALMPTLLHTKTGWVRLLVMLMIMLVCMARVYTLNHWFSDVYVGVLLGGMVGYASYLANRRMLTSF